MTTMGATQVRNNFFKMLNTCIKYNEPINISTKKGNVVLMTEEEYKGWKATMEICSVVGLKESILKADKAPSSEYKRVNIDEL